MNDRRKRMAIAAVKKAEATYRAKREAATETRRKAFQKASDAGLTYEEIGKAASISKSRVPQVLDPEYDEKRPSQAKAA